MQFLSKEVRSEGTSIEQEKRMPSVDQIRGLCMTLVIIEHGLYYVVHMAEIGEWGGYEFICKMITLFHMPLMFCVSGYLQSMHRKRSFAASLTKDLLSLYIPYLLLVYGCLIERIAGKALFGIVGETPIDITLSGFVKRMFISDGTTWFLLSLLLVKTAVRLLDERMGAEVILILSVLIVFAVWLGWPEALIYVRYMPAYVMGYSMYERHIERCKGLSIGAVLIVTASVIYVIILPANILLNNIAGTAFFYIFMMYPKLLPKGNGITLCGKESMVLYAIHVLTEWPLLILTQYFISNALLFVVMYLAESLAIFVLVYYLYTRVKAFRWMEYLFYPYKLYVRLSNRKKRL